MTARSSAAVLQARTLRIRSLNFKDMVADWCYLFISNGGIQKDI